MFDFRRTERSEIRGEEEKHQPLFDSHRENTLRYYPELCINCKRCTQVCPHGVFAEGPEHAELVSPSSCMECGACAGNCPVQAITVESGVGCAWAMIGAALRGKDIDAGCDCCGTDGTCCQTPGAGNDSGQKSLRQQ